MTERDEAGQTDGSGQVDGRTTGTARRRQFLTSAGAGVASVALAGCNALPTGGANRGDGDGGGGGGNSVDRLRLGVLGLVPDSNPLGKSMVNGARLAAQELSASDSFGADVEVLTGDTEGSPGTAKQEYERLVRKERVDATFGVFRNQVLGALLPNLADAKTLHFTTAAIGTGPAEKVGEEYERYKYHFRPWPLNVAQLGRAQIDLLGRHADRLGWQTAAVVVEDLDEFDPFYDRLVAEAPQHLEVVEDGRTPLNLRDWRPVFDNVEEKNPDVMLTAQSISGVGAAKVWGTQQRSFEFGGLHVPSQVPRFYSEVNGTCRYIFSMTVTTPGSENTDRTKAFADAYRDEFGGHPPYTGVTTYDAVRMYADAVQQRGTKDPAELIPYLEQRTYTDGIVAPEHEFQGPDGTFPHDPVWRSTPEGGVPLWHQWQERDGEGVQAVFAPEKHKRAQYQKPPWIE